MHSLTLTESVRFESRWQAECGEFEICELFATWKVVHASYSTKNGEKEKALFFPLIPYSTKISKKGARFW